MCDKKKTRYGNTMKELKREIEQRKEALIAVQKESREQVERIEELVDTLTNARYEIVKLQEIIHNYESVSTPVNACADEKAPEHPPTLYRVVTNGEEFRVERSINSGETWMIAGIAIPCYEGAGDRPRYFKSYNKAVKYIHKEFGLTATILPRVWRAV